MAPCVREQDGDAATWTAERDADTGVEGTLRLRGPLRLSKQLLAHFALNFTLGSHAPQPESLGFPKVDTTLGLEHAVLQPSRSVRGDADGAGTCVPLCAMRPLAPRCSHSPPPLLAAPFALHTRNAETLSRTRRGGGLSGRRRARTPRQHTSRPPCPSASPHRTARATLKLDDSLYH